MLNQRLAGAGKSLRICAHLVHRAPWLSAMVVGCQSGRVSQAPASLRLRTLSLRDPPTDPQYIRLVVVNTPVSVRRAHLTGCYGYNYTGY